MSKEYNIHWRRSDYSKLSHLVRKVNKKIFEIEVKRPDIAEYQPEWLDYQELKSQIKTRKDFNLLMNKYNRYLREGSEELKKSKRGAVATTWEVDNRRIYEQAEIRRQKNKLKLLEQQEVTIMGKPTGNTRAEMGSTEKNANSGKKKNFDNMSMDDFKYNLRMLEKKMFSSYENERKFEMIRRYIKGLIAEGYDDELIEMLRHISLEDFERIIFTDETATYDFIYDPAGLEANQEILKNLWREHIDVNIKHDFDFDTIINEVRTEYETGQRIRGQGRVRQSQRRH